MRMKMKGEDRISNEDKSRVETARETKRGGTRTGGIN